MSRNPCRIGARSTIQLLVFALLAFAGAIRASAQEAGGAISGRVINENTGLGVSNVSITAMPSGMQTISDLSGAYSLRDVPAGNANLVMVKDGMQTTTVTAVAVIAGEVTSMNLPMRPEGFDVIEMAAFSVTADIVQSSDIGLLVARQKSATVSDAISSDQFSRLAVGDAAEALSKVTGASVVDGKYVLIRGLGDRYSNTLMNGVSVPSADPDKRAVQMDQFPSDLIDSIVTTKSFTPDQPGSFSGGSVNLKTKSFPEQFFVSFSTSIGSNSQYTGDPILITQGHGDKAPLIEGNIPNSTAAELDVLFRGDFTQADALDTATRAFDPAGYFPGDKSAGYDTGFSTAFGNRFAYGDEGLIGVTASFNYARSYDHYEGGEAGRYSGLPSAPESLLVLTNNQDLLSFPIDSVTAGTPPFGVTSSTRNESLGGFLKLAWRPSIDHEVSLDLLYNESVADNVRRGIGEEINNYAGSVYEVYDLLRTERSVSSAQLAGKSLFMGMNETEIEWRLSHSESTQDQPDYRTLAGIYAPDGGPVNATGVQPNRYFRTLDEEADEGGIDITVPFSSDSREHRVKFGGMASHNERVYDEQRFQYSSAPDSRDDLISYPNPIGITSRGADFVTFGNTITRLQEPNKYFAEQDVSGIYAMVDYQLTDNIRAITGARYEDTKISTIPVKSPGLNPNDGLIDQGELLPALSVVYNQNDRMNWRAAYGRTIARPTYKELTDIRYEDVFTSDTYIGNSAVDLTVIDNFDVRWEWFPRKGETVAISAFYKSMDKPIEVLFQPSVGSIQPQNVETGTVFGVEFEFRRNLDFISDSLSAFSLGGNLSLIESEVTIPDAELALLRSFDANASSKRELLGQSPYVFNADVSYDNDASGTSATLSYNIVGERLDLVVFGPMPDVYEQPAPSLNLVIAQRLSDRWKIKLSAKNLLNPDKEKLISIPNGDDLVYNRYTSGRSVSVSISYLFE